MMIVRLCVKCHRPVERNKQTRARGCMTFLFIILNDDPTLSRIYGSFLILLVGPIFFIYSSFANRNTPVISKKSIKLP